MSKKNKIKNLPIYDIPGTVDINLNRTDKSYQDPKTWSSYQKDYQDFLHNITTWFNNNEPKVLLRIYDGEIWFLLNKKVGNIGKRHVSKNLTPEFTNIFYQNALKCDKFTSHLTVMPNGAMHKLFKEAFPNKTIDYPMEFHYAIVINKWIFKNFKNQIGIIGGNEKINIIKQLMKHTQYRDYLGIDYFTDYISVPERYSCDDHLKLDSDIKSQLINAKGKIFLFGIGISKMAVAYKFKEYHPAIYIDVGCGLSALAGFLTRKRPYAANWTNFRLKKYDYSKVDKMDVDKSEKIIYL